MKQLKDLMKTAIRMELQVSIQYMWQHLLWSGIRGFSISKELENIAIAEMKHAEMIGDRLAYLGGDLPTQPFSVKIGNNFFEFLENDRKAEKETINLYRKIIETSQKEKDYTTSHLFQKILSEEEEHHDFFISILEDYDKEYWINFG
jgi:bacterioferritin